MICWRLLPPLSACLLLLVAPRVVSAQFPAEGGPYPQSYAAGADQACWTGPQPQVPGAFFEATSLYWRDIYDTHYDPCVPPLPTNLIPARWYAMVEALPLLRDAEREVGFARLGAGGPVVLSTSGQDFEFDWNAHYVLGCALNEWYRLEASYFGTHSWNVADSVRNNDLNALGAPGNLFSIFPGGPTVGVDYNDLVSIRTDSALNNFEVNLRHRMPMPPGRPYEASLIYGARFMDIHEDFSYRSESNLPAPTGTILTSDVSTDNDLIGVQLGLLGQFLAFDRTWIDWELKGAMCHNVASQETFYRNEGAAITTATAAAEEDRTAFIGETSVILNYQVTPRFTCRVGYRALWITGVALAADNVDSPDVIIAGPAGLEDSGEIVYHGPSLGLVWTR